MTCSDHCLHVDEELNSKRCNLCYFALIDPLGPAMSYEAVHFDEQRSAVSIELSPNGEGEVIKFVLCHI